MRNVLITGVNDGIGAELYKYFLMKDCEVWGTARHGKSTEILANLNTNYHSRAHTIDLNLDNLHECEIVSKNFGANLDLLILNAASFGNDCYYLDEKIKIEKLIELFNVNVFSNLILIKNLSQKMGIELIGKIIFISTGNASIYGNKNNEMFGYKITKTTMNQAIRTISNEYINRNIVSVCLNPGWVKTKIGGINATLTTDIAAQQIFYFSQNLNLTHNGKYLNTDMTELPW